MRAITYDRFGPAAEALTLEDMPVPTPGDGEVLVRLHTSAVNPSDVRARAGGRPGVTKPPFEVIVPHSDGAGVIEAVGDGVDAARVGERVWLWNGQWQRPFGTCAEYICMGSGTYAGVGMGIKPEPIYLKAGDVMELGIDGLGQQRQVVRADS